MNSKPDRSRGKLFVLDLGGTSNIVSMRNVLNYLEYPHESGLLDEKSVNKFDALIIPGVASFAAWMEAAALKGQDLFVKEFALSGKPILGICSGMQVMFSEGLEGGPCKGLDLLQGAVIPLPSQHLSMPLGLNVGWSTLKPDSDSSCASSTDLLAPIKDSDFFYFSHRYFVNPGRAGDIKAFSVFADRLIPAVVQNDNIFGVQFHPERSDKAGRSLIAHFAEMVVYDA